VVALLEPREVEPALFAGAVMRIVDAQEPLREELDDAFGDGQPTPRSRSQPVIEDPGP